MLAPGLLAGLILGPSATPHDVVVRWRGAPSCQQGPHAQTTVRTLLEGQNERAAQARIDVREDGSQWRAQIEVEIDGHDAPIHRELRGTPCLALADAIALVVAISIDPLSASASVDNAGDGPGIPRPSIPRATDEPTLPAPAGLESVVTEPPERAASVERTASAGPTTQRTIRRSPWRLSGLVAGGITLGLLPGIGGRLGGGLVVSRGPVQVVGSGHHGFARTVRHPDGIDAGANLSTTAGRLLACWAPTPARFTLSLCSGLEAGVYAADGIGLERTARVRTTWVAALPQARLTVWAWPWLGVGPSLELPLALTRPRFSIDDFRADLVQVDPVGLRLALAIELVFFDESRARRARGPAKSP